MRKISPAVAGVVAGTVALTLFWGVLGLFWNFFINVARVQDYVVVAWEQAPWAVLIVNIFIFGVAASMTFVLVRNRKAPESTVEPTKHTRLHLPNPTMRGTVVLSSRPSAAEVYVDGHFVGQTPCTLQLSFGEHSIVVRNCSSNWSRMLMVAGPLVTIDAALQATNTSAPQEPART